MGSRAGPAHGGGSCPAGDWTPLPMPLLQLDPARYLPSTGRDMQPPWSPCGTKVQPHIAHSCLHPNQSARGALPALGPCTLRPPLLPSIPPFHHRYHCSSLPSGPGASPGALDTHSFAFEPDELEEEEAAETHCSPKSSVSSVTTPPAHSKRIPFFRKVTEPNLAHACLLHPACPNTAGGCGGTVGWIGP